MFEKTMVIASPNDARPAPQCRNRTVGPDAWRLLLCSSSKRALLVLYASFAVLANHGTRPLDKPACLLTMVTGG